MDWYAITIAGDNACTVRESKREIDDCVKSLINHTKAKSEENVNNNNLNKCKHIAVSTVNSNKCDSSNRSYL